MSMVLLCRTITDLLKRFGYKYEAKAAHKHGGYFRNDADHRDYVGIGTAAGKLVSAVHAACTSGATKFVSMSPCSLC